MMHFLNTMKKKKYIKEKSSADEKSESNEAIVIGTSAGGLTALSQIVRQIDKNFHIPMIVVQHLHPDSDNFIARNLNSICSLQVCEANEKQKILGGKIYIAPPNYHLMIEPDKRFSLNIDAKVNYSRPSIDVLFESAAEVYGETLIGVLLTGANSDGAIGLKRIKELGGVTIVQDPKTAEVPMMPQSAIDLFRVDYILPLNEIYKKIKYTSERRSK